MLLEGKNAVIYGGGTIGGAVARAFACEGATVHLAGRTLAKPERVAGEIRQSGGTATVAQVDALDERAVDTHADELVRNHGTLDISMNLVSTGDVQGTPLVEMELADFERPIHNAMRSTYVTARAARRHMIRQGSGVILMFGGEGDPIRDYNIGGFQISLTAVDPKARRRGVAAALAAEVIGLADSEGVGCYLETFGPQTKALYERRGFVVRKQFRPREDAPQGWLLWRSPT